MGWGKNHEDADSAVRVVLFQKIQDSVHVDEEFWLVALVLQKCTVPFIKHFFPFLSWWSLFFRLRAYWRVRDSFKRNAGLLFSNEHIWRRCRTSYIKRPEQIQWIDICVEILQFDGLPNRLKFQYKVQSLFSIRSQYLGPDYWSATIAREPRPPFVRDAAQQSKQTMRFRELLLLLLLPTSRRRRWESPFDCIHCIHPDG